MPRKIIKHFSQGAINLLVLFKTANRTASIKRAGRGKDDEDGGGGCGGGGGDDGGDDDDDDLLHDLFISVISCLDS